jgi:hypothetical protein
MDGNVGDWTNIAPLGLDALSSFAHVEQRAATRAS